MTSQEIKARHPARGRKNETWELLTVEWLREIAYQFAVLNERNADGDEKAVSDLLRKVGLLPEPHRSIFVPAVPKVSKKRR